MTNQHLTSDQFSQKMRDMFAEIVKSFACHDLLDRENSSSYSDDTETKEVV